MSQSLTQVYLHIVFSTKHRKRFLQDKQTRAEMHAYLVGICRNVQSPSLVVGGADDHIHILCRQSKNLTVVDFLRELKRDSSSWVKKQFPEISSFYWQQGYGAFSISPSHVDALRQYIAGQEEHHRQESFQDEFRRLCKKYGVDLDERYAWD